VADEILTALSAMKYPGLYQLQKIITRKNERSVESGFRAFKLTEGLGSFSPIPHPEQSEVSLVNFSKGSIEILQPFGLQDEGSKNSSTPQLTTKLLPGL